MLLLGYFAWWIKAFDAEPVIGINELALEIALPASLFAGIVSIPRMQQTLDTYLVVAVLVDLVSLYVIALIVGMAAAIFALGSLVSFGAIPWAVRSGRTFWARVRRLR